MSYTINFSESAFRQLKKLDLQLQQRIFHALERIQIRPEMFVQRLVGDTAYKLRVGDYRVLMDIDHDSLKITIIKIGHRKNVYNRIRV